MTHLTGALVRRTGKSIIEELQGRPNQLALDLKAATETGRQTRGRDLAYRAAANLVFAYWAAKYDHPRSWIDRERVGVIVNRLEETDGDISELLYAIDGGLKDDWVMGRARNCRHRNDGLLYLFRSREKVEQLAEKCRGYREDRRHPMVIKYVDHAGVQVEVHTNGNGNGVQ